MGRKESESAIAESAELHPLADSDACLDGIVYGDVRGVKVGIGVGLPDRAADVVR